MPIPDFQSLMLPLLRITEDEKEHPVTEFRQRMADAFKLTTEEISEKLKSGSGIFGNRVAWAVPHLNRAGLLNLRSRGVYQITDCGLTVLKTNPVLINIKALRQFPGYVFSKQKGTSPADDGTPVQTIPDQTIHDLAQTPEEQLEESFQVLRDALAEEVVQVLLNVTPAAFEQVVVDLLVAMGYGGSVEDAGSVVGKSGDGGIDGVIKQDKLGLDVVYVQAKRWKDCVGRPEIMKFSGSLAMRHAIKGIFITTSSFSKDALEYVKGIAQKIVLIDGAELALFMIDHNVGVAPAKSYILKRLDQDYFESL